MLNRVIHGDCREVLKTLPENHFHSVVTDPPYELGLHGKSWDSTGIAFAPETWKAVMRVMRPGAYLLAFGGSRTQHRITCAIEDAGFVIKDCMMWLYGQGFPKASDVGRTAGEEWSGWSTQLKPAYEPVVVAQKPIGEQTITQNLLAYGAGALNIEACRIESAKPREKINAKVQTGAKTFGRGGIGGGSEYQGFTNYEGRWPANVILDDIAAKMVDEQSGERPSPGGPGKQDSYAGGKHFKNLGTKQGPLYLNESGGASRFFYVAKPRATERGCGNDHPCVKPLDLMTYLVKLATPASGVVLDPFAGSGTTLLACKRLDVDFVGIEREEQYISIIHNRLAAMPDSLFKATC